MDQASSSSASLTTSIQNCLLHIPPLPQRRKIAHVRQTILTHGLGNPQAGDGSETPDKDALVCVTKPKLQDQHSRRVTTKRIGLDPTLCKPISPFCLNFRPLRPTGSPWSRTPPQPIVGARNDRRFIVRLFSSQQTSGTRPSPPASRLIPLL
jgi:hypothetical protein